METLVASTVVGASVASGVGKPRFEEGLATALVHDIDSATK